MYCNSVTRPHPLVQAPMIRRNATVVLAAILITATANSGFAQIRYQTPSPDLVRVLEAPAAPVTTVSPNRQWLLVTSSDPRSITIRDMAEPAYYLAGSKIRATPSAKIENIGIVSASVVPVNGTKTRVLGVPPAGRLGSAVFSRDGTRVAYTAIDKGAMRLYQVDLASGSVRRLDGAGTHGRIGDLSWSGDNKHLAFMVTTPAGVALWVADAAQGARQLTPPQVTFVNTGSGRFQAPACSWLNTRPELVCKMFPADRGAPPKLSDVPSGPIVQESFGKSAPARTYEYLLSSPDDERMFDYYFTDQLAIVSLNGGVTRIGPRGIHTLVSQSPDANYLLVRTVQRPYSYQVPLGSFPSRTEVWTMKGATVHTVTSLPTAQDAPSGRDAVIPGIRNVAWRTDEPATLVLVEALDNGDPRAKVAKRDRVSLLSAPFNAASVPLFETVYRYGGVTWIAPKSALITERLSRGARTRSWLIDPSLPGGGVPKLMWERSSEDRYTDPGDFVTVRDAATNRENPLLSPDGRYVYLAGSGESAEGAHAFVDRLDLQTGKTDRLWRASGPSFDS